MAGPAVQQFDHYFTTDDGVRLHYVQAGGGGKLNEQAETLILLPGWSLTSNQFQAQIDALATPSRQVIALDPRGHGSKSDKPDHGYTLARMAKDVLNLFDHVGVKQAHLLGHSIGCPVIWTFIELFGESRLKSIILVDHFIAYIKKEEWSAKECHELGAIATLEEACTIADSLSKPGEARNDFHRQFMRSMLSDNISNDKFEALMKDSSLFPCQNGAGYLWRNLTNDYRPILPQITVPALCVVGGESRLLLTECMQYMATTMKNARCEVIPGGSHIMFYDDPAPFNEVMGRFLQSQKRMTKAT